MKLQGLVDKEESTYQMYRYVIRYKPENLQYLEEQRR